MLLGNWSRILFLKKFWWFALEFYVVVLVVVYFSFLMLPTCWLLWDCSKPGSEFVGLILRQMNLNATSRRFSWWENDMILNKQIWSIILMMWWNRWIVEIWKILILTRWHLSTEISCFFYGCFLFVNLCHLCFNLFWRRWYYCFRLWKLCMDLSVERLCVRWHWSMEIDISGRFVYIFVKNPRRGVTISKSRWWWYPSLIMWLVWFPIQTSRVKASSSGV
jgi:hypothetical protein